MVLVLLIRWQVKFGQLVTNDADYLKQDDPGDVTGTLATCDTHRYCYSSYYLFSVCSRDAIVGPWLAEKILSRLLGD